SGYVAPESKSVLLGEALVRADVYSLGAIAFALLTGEGPFERFVAGPDRASAQLRVAVPSVAVIAPHLPRALDRAFRSILAIDPRERPASAELAMRLL
ncbi:serine/threonine protein kinase, partial [Streptomyces scabiei]